MIVTAILTTLLAMCLWFGRGCIIMCVPSALTTNSIASSGAAPTKVDSARPSPPRYQALAETLYQSPAKYLFNASRSFVLCVDQPRSRQPVGPGTAAPSLRFFVYDLHADQIVLEEAVDNARVEWESDTTIKVMLTPGMVPDLELREYGYRFDVVTRSREDL